MLLAEFLGKRRQNFNISIQATDICPTALDEARHSIYLPTHLEGLTQAMKDSHFTRFGNDYVINTDIRQMHKKRSVCLTPHPECDGNLSALLE